MAAVRRREWVAPTKAAGCGREQGPTQRHMRGEQVP